MNYSMNIERFSQKYQPELIERKIQKQRFEIPAYFSAPNTMPDLAIIRRYVHESRFNLHACVQPSRCLPFCSERTQLNISASEGLWFMVW